MSSNTEEKKMQVDYIFTIEDMENFECNEKYRVNREKYADVLSRKTDVKYVYYSGLGSHQDCLHTLDEFLVIIRTFFPGMRADWLNTIGLVGAGVIWKN